MYNIYNLIRLAINYFNYEIYAFNNIKPLVLSNKSRYGIMNFNN